MNKIQLETEQKKEYVAPQMEIVEMKEQTSVLFEGSCQTPGFCGETI